MTEPRRPAACRSPVTDVHDGSPAAELRPRSGPPTSTFVDWWRRSSSTNRHRHRFPSQRFTRSGSSVLDKQHRSHHHGRPHATATGVQPRVGVIPTTTSTISTAITVDLVPSSDGNRPLTVPPLWPARSGCFCGDPYRHRHLRHHRDPATGPRPATYHRRRLRSDPGSVWVWGRYRPRVRRLEIEEFMTGTITGHPIAVPRLR